PSSSSDAGRRAKKGPKNAMSPQTRGLAGTWQTAIFQRSRLVSSGNRRCLLEASGRRRGELRSPVTVQRRELDLDRRLSVENPGRLEPGHQPLVGELRERRLRLPHVGHVEEPVAVEPRNVVETAFGRLALPAHDL